MAARFLLFRRGKVFYAEDTQTKQQTSLRTKDRAEAQRLLVAHAETITQPALNTAIAKVYLSAQDPALVNRTWQDVIDAYVQQGKVSSQDRSSRATRSKPFQIIRGLKIVETTQTHFEAILKLGGASANNYLRRLHNFALKRAWLLSPILPPAMWPTMKSQPRRAVTEAEHTEIIENEHNLEQKHYYELLWETGGAQSDVAELSWDNVNSEKGVLVYHRKKTGEKCQLSIGASLSELLLKLPQSGYFFPHLRTIEAKHRSCEFKRRCRILKIEGVSLHCYRYAWAQRAFAAGYPERFAQAALGHKSKAIHWAYARNADVVCPPLEDFEGKKNLPMARPPMESLSAASAYRPH